MGLVWSVVLAAFGAFLAYGGAGALRATGAVLCCAALLVVAVQPATMALAARREERAYRRYDGP